jgi:hypothetical protein
MAVSQPTRTYKKDEFYSEMVLNQHYKEITTEEAQWSLYNQSYYIKTCSFLHYMEYLFGLHILPLRGGANINTGV